VEEVLWDEIPRATILLTAGKRIYVFLLSVSETKLFIPAVSQNAPQGNE